MATKWQLVAVVTMMIGCGGHKSQPAAPTGGDDSGGEAAEPASNDGMVPPETFDKIKEALDAKRLVVSRCLSDAVTAGQAAKNLKGAVTVNFVIAPDGHAKDVKVGKSTVSSKVIEDCVVEKVGQIGFPEVPKDLDWSYTYAFESN